MLWSFGAHWATSHDIKTCCKPNQANAFPPELSELCSIKGGISHIKSFETDPERTKYLKLVVALQELDHVWNLWSLLSHFKNKITYETALPIDQDALEALALHLLEVDLDLPEHEVVRLRVPVADRQQLLQARRVQLLWDFLDYLAEFLTILPWKFQIGSLRFWPKNLKRR